MDGERVVENGWSFPADLETPPPEQWFEIDFGGGPSVNDMTRDGHLQLLRQRDLDSMETDIVATGEDSDGVLWAAAKATVVVDGETWSAIGSADVTSNQVRDPEYLWSVAASRAIKRAAKHSLGIWSAGEDTAPAADPEVKGSSSPTPPPDSPVDKPPSEWDDPSEGQDESGDESSENPSSDGSVGW
jgi:hypothetical protein